MACRAFSRKEERSSAGTQKVPVNTQAGIHKMPACLLSQEQSNRRCAPTRANRATQGTDFAENNQTTVSQRLGLELVMSAVRVRGSL